MIWQRIFHNISNFSKKILEKRKKLEARKNPFYHGVRQNIVLVREERDLPVRGGATTLEKGVVVLVGEAHEARVGPCRRRHAAGRLARPPVPLEPKWQAQDICTGPAHRNRSLVVVRVSPQLDISFW